MKSKKRKLAVSAVSYKDSEWFKNLMQKLTKTEPIENEIDILRPMIMMG
jgi:cytochrome c oxidase cbb3-type subunit 3